MRERRKHWYEIRAWADGWDIENKEADPYTELKAAAKDPTKQIRDKVANAPWYDCGDATKFAFILPASHYEIRDKPKTKKVKLLAYLTSTGLEWRKEWISAPDSWVRVPSEDKEIEVEE